jgi:hypothetical protein
MPSKRWKDQCWKIKPTTTVNGHIHDIMQERQHTDSETPKHWPKNMPFRLPAHYFARQRKSILMALQYERIGMPVETALDEIDRLSPLLSELKQQGINGRWNDRRPEYLPGLTQQQIKTDIKIKQAPVKSMKKAWRRAAAAAMTGIILAGGFLMYRPEQERTLAQQQTSAGMISDSVGFSDEDIRSYLSETLDLPAETPPNINEEKSPEVYLASADMLKAPEAFTTQMESIPVDELEAFINDVPTFEN